MGRKAKVRKRKARHMRKTEVRLPGRNEAMREQVASAQPTESARQMHQDEAYESVEAEPVPYDEGLLDAARTQWQFGDWASLAALDTARIQHHPERARLALLAAAGRFQCADRNEAHRYARLAQDWGANSRLIAQVLISGVHNTLGHVRALLGYHEKASRHFADAIRYSGVSGDVRLLTQIREEWQMTECNTKGDSIWERNS